MVATAEKVARIGRWGGGVWVIRAMPELKRFYSYDVFPKVIEAISIHSCVFYLNL